MNAEYTCEIKTAFNKDRIESWLEFKDNFSTEKDLISQHTKQIINLREQSIREALIKLGWTPPPEENVE
jgi:hypothetical protein